MLDNVLSIGPTSNSVDAVMWQDYDSKLTICTTCTSCSHTKLGGIIQHHCTGNVIDHAVQIVGFNMTGETRGWNMLTSHDASLTNDVL